MEGSTWDALGIPGYYVLRDCGGLYGGKYLGYPWYPGILCIEVITLVETELVYSNKQL